MSNVYEPDVSKLDGTFPRMDLPRSHPWNWAQRVYAPWTERLLYTNDEIVYHFVSERRATLPKSKVHLKLYRMP